MVKNSVERRRRLGRLLVLKASLRQKENEKDSSVATNQLQVALPAPAKISINRAANVINVSSSRKCHRPVQPVPVKDSINQAANIINASSSRKCRRLALRIRLRDRKVVLTAKDAGNTKRRA